jgi:hypothetical protein
MATPSSRRINKLAEKFNAKTYLEIGVANGHTFFDVNIEQKTAVDPNFKFNKSEYETENTQFCEVVSDIFFANLAQYKKYDLICLNNAHSFEQTFRDFTNSLAYSHDQTIWLVDNVFPYDVYSTLKDHKQAVNYRRSAGGQGPAWHGDVYKLVFALHDFFPAFSYCTINTLGNPQTLVWYGKRVLMPRFNDFEKISRLDYFTLQEHLDLMVFKPENQAFNFIGKSLKPEHFTVFLK